jgi:general secretion pathway protein E/type IV pilus assembly protein PilB
LVFDVKPSDESSAVDATIAQLVNQILIEALRLRATDIHIEPYPSAIHLRYRIDGLIQSVPVPTALRPIYPALVSRLKIMAGLNIAEKRLTHDGRIAMKLQDQDYDLRASIIPTKHGEGVCLRILGRQSLMMDLVQLGMDPRQEAIFAELTQLPQGLVLLTGPTGSGKTTSLYAALAQANDGLRKIITIEDPIEYQLEGISQIQVREDIGLSFASGLRSVLRHDPDVVLIGEIRDAETAEIAVRAAQTGHLVFSTLHTNDSVSTFTRLLGMKIDAFLVSSSLVCSIAQRLARRICRHCIEEDDNVPDPLRQEMVEALHLPPGEVRVFKGRGCVECNQQGTRGRIAIYEFFLLNDELADLIGLATKTGELREVARRYGWRSLREEGWIKVQNGLISLAEQQRLTRRINPDAMM